MSEYRYPKINASGFRWHIIYKFWLLTGVQVHTMYDTANQTIFRFESELTTEQETTLASLATDPDPFSPDSPITLDDTNQTFFIRDLFGSKSWFVEWIDSMGIPGLVATMWFVSTGDHGTRKDGILVKFNKILTQQDRKKIEEAYAGAGQFGSWG
jgi:hypothetical protein